MASIQTRGDTFYVAYSIKDPISGKFDTPWVPFDNEEDAIAFKAKIENEIADQKKQRKEASSVSNATRTLEQLIWQYVELVGKTKWGVKTYPDYVARIENYIIPHVGSWRVWDCTVLRMDEYFARLKTLDAVTQRGKKTKKISAKVIHEIHKFMKALFNQAAEWEMIDKNPCKKVNSTIPEYEQNRRPAWTRNQFLEAVKHAEQMEDLTLCVAMYLSVSTTLREGEICGLQWDRVYISDEDIARGDCRVYVDREMARVDKKAMETLEKKDILHVFPNILGNSKSSMVLKKPKTKGSVRVVWVAATAAKMLQKLKEQQEKRKDFLGMDYRDNDLVMTPGDGRPFEGSKLNNRLQSLIKRHNLFRVTFHSFRHTSTSYKLRISHGDIKSVQGDTGHGSSQMVTETYAEIIDEDRKYNALHFESHFFQSDSPTEMNQKEEQARRRENELSPGEMMSFMTFMQSNPEFVRQVIANNGASAISR